MPDRGKDDGTDHESDVPPLLSQPELEQRIAIALDDATVFINQGTVSARGGLTLYASGARVLRQ